MHKHNLVFLFLMELCAGAARGAYLVCIGWTTLIVSGDVARERRLQQCGDRVEGRDRSARFRVQVERGEDLSVSVEAEEVQLEGDGHRSRDQALLV